jgi:putative ABC transport system permease protein
MDSVIQDLRFTIRQLARQRAFTLIALVTLALGIGATSTFFSILNSVAFRPLPFLDADRLVAIDRVAPTGAGRSRISGAQFATVREAAPVDAAVAYVTRPVTVSAGAAGAGGAAAEQVAGAEISGDLFGLLGISLHTGRSLRTGEREPVAVISHEVWTRRFASDPAALGALVSLDGTAHTIVGIAAAGFGFPSDARVWFPLAPNSPQRRVDAIARLRRGVSPREAATSFGTIAATPLADAQEGTGWTFGAVPLRDAVLGSKQRDAAMVLLGASALVLIVACANLAGLMLAYMSSRRHELAVRAAMGAARRRLIRQLMMESAVLATAGGLLGALLAQWGVDLFISTLGKPGGASWMSFALDGKVLLFTLGVSAATALLFGMAPAIGGSRVDIRSVLQESRQSSGSGSGHRARRILVGAQVALSLGLVAGGTSVVMSSMSMEDVHPGFDREGLVMLRAALPGARYDAAPARMAFVDAARERLRGVPGVAAVSAVSHAPLVDRNPPVTNFMAEGWSSAGSLPIASLRFVDADYIDVMRIPIRGGRAFTPAEARDVRGTTILINDTMARRHWPGRDPIGGRIRLPGAANPGLWFTIVGVVGEVAQRKLPSEPENQIYFPLPNGRDVALALRVTSSPAIAGAAAREALQAIDASVAITAHGMDATYKAYALDRRQQGSVLAALGLIAVLVAALGVYGVMSLTVAERGRELAVRVALGSTSGGIVRLILANAVRLVSLGVGAGLVLAVAVTGFLSWIFFGLHAFDPRVFAAAAGILGGAALVAAWLPARTAGRVDPMAALKN